MYRNSKNSIRDYETNIKMFQEYQNRPKRMSANLVKKKKTHCGILSITTTIRIKHNKYYTAVVQWFYMI